MTRLIQISDLHFGRDRPELVGPLTEAIRDAGPDMVLMAGDFVQRARDGQFAEARAFMDGLGIDWMGVPGNHDVPLFDLWSRLVHPYATYERHISDEREPRAEIGDALILGLDTTDPHSHQRGAVSEADIERIGAEIARHSAERTVIVLAHHPFHQREDVEKKLMMGAPAALHAWAEAGPHMVLTGHLHTWLVEPFVTRKGARMTLQVHAGTGLSTRKRGEPNDFAILDLHGDRVDVTRMAEADGAFAALGTDGFQRSASGWTRLSDTMAERDAAE